MQIPSVSELRAGALMGVGRAAIRAAALTGDPAAKALGYRPLKDPYPLYDQVRLRGPVVTSKLGLAATASHAVSWEVLRDNDFLVAPAEDFGPIRWDTYRGKPVAHIIEHSLLAMNPPDHGRLRKVVAPWFTPRAIRTQQETVERTVHRFLDDLGRREEFDLVPEFAVRVPVRVICALLDVDDSAHERFARWGRIVGGALDGVRSLREYRQVGAALVEMTEFFTDLVERRRREPGEDVVSGMLAADAGLTPRDLVSTTGLLLGAGFETTMSLIGNGTYALLRHPDQRDALVGSPDLAGNAVEEVLRWESPVRNTARVPRTDTEVAGVPVAKGTLLVTMLAGANRDPEVFDDAHRFDIRRPNAREHLAFSAGAHFCLGSGLARMEAEIALRELFLRFPRLSTAGHARRGASRTLNGFTALPVRAGARRSVFV
jgi:cytochrome P450